MRKIIFLLIFSVISIFACSKVEEEGKKKMEEKSQKKLDDAFSEFAEKGKGYIDQSKDLKKESEEAKKESEKAIEEMLPEKQQKDE